MGGGRGDSGDLQRGRHTLVGALKSEAEEPEPPSPSGSQTPAGPRHPFYHGETEVLRRGRDSPKVTAIAVSIPPPPWSLPPGSH